MGLFGYSEQDKLDMFRRNFLRLTADGCYPPQRQQRLYQWCQKHNIDWNTARQYVAPEAIELLHHVIGNVVADGRVTPDEVRGLRSLQRRLGLDDQIEPVVRLYRLIERKIETMLLERAAYISSDKLIELTKGEIAAYRLPPEREARLVQLLDRQHQLAKPMVGELPVVKPSVTLYKDEVCHIDIPAALLPAGETAKISGRLVATSIRLMLLSAAGGKASTWRQIDTITPLGDYILVHLIQPGVPVSRRKEDARLLALFGSIYCQDTQYVATVLTAAHRFYTASPQEPIRPDRRLPTL